MNNRVSAIASDVLSNLNIISVHLLFQISHVIFVFTPDRNFKIQLVPIPLSGRPSKSSYFEHLRDFYRSDHFNFWENSVTFPAVMVTDTSNFRGNMRKCYHRRCDSMKQIDWNDLEFLRRNADAVIKATVELSQRGELIKWRV